MPPQQGDRLLDLVDEAFRFGAHRLALSVRQYAESARNIGTAAAPVKDGCRESRA
jgi:hypothetical protein